MSKHTPDLHGQVMNIQTTSAGIGRAVEEGIKLNNDIESKLALAYKLGHRDARHAAAELACSIDARIAELEAEVAAPILTAVNRLADQLADERAKVERLREEMSELYRETLTILETARNIMVGMGRPCDSVEMMVKQNPCLIRAREALAATESVRE